MAQFEQTIAVDASADGVFDFVSDVRNVPQYLPAIERAEPQQGERIHTQGHIGERPIDSDGYFRVNRAERRMEWGSDGENDYRGWLAVSGDGSRAEVKVHIDYAPPPQMQQAMAARTPGGSFESAMYEGIGKTLISIKNLCEGRGGKEELEVNRQVS